MAVRRRLNGHSPYALSRRLDALEDVAHVQSADEAWHELREQLWEAMPGVVRCVIEQDDGRDTLLGLAVHGMVEGTDPLVRIAGWVLRHAHQRLGCAYIRADGRHWWTSGSDDPAPAASDLFGLSELEEHRLWTGDPEGEQYLKLWAENGTTDPRILEMAGLGVSQVGLLEMALGRRSDADCPHADQHLPLRPGWTLNTLDSVMCGYWRPPWPHV